MSARSRTRALCAAAALLGLPATAHASHYNLPEVSDRLSAPAMAAFVERGLATTLDVLRNVDTFAERQALSSVTGLSLEELTEIARMCEFIQVDGIGPKAFDLLVAAGVQDLPDLADREAAQLHAEVVRVNAVQQITGVDPEVGLIAFWIQSASTVPIRVEY